MSPKFSPRALEDPEARKRRVQRFISDEIWPIKAPKPADEKARELSYFIHPSSENEKRVIDPSVVPKLNRNRLHLLNSLFDRDWVAEQTGLPGRKTMPRASEDDLAAHEERLRDLLVRFRPHLEAAEHITPKTNWPKVFRLIRALQHTYVHAVRDFHGVGASSGLYEAVRNPKRVSHANPSGIVVQPIRSNERVETFDSNHEIPPSDLTDPEAMKSRAFLGFLERGQHYMVPEIEGPEADFMSSQGSTRYTVENHLLGKEYHVFKVGERVFGLGSYFSVPIETLSASRPHLTSAPLSALMTAIAQLAIQRKVEAAPKGKKR